MQRIVLQGAIARQELATGGSVHLLLDLLTSDRFTLSLVLNSASLLPTLPADELVGLPGVIAD